MVAEDGDRRIIQSFADAGARDPELRQYYELHQTLFRLQGEEKANLAATLEMAQETLQKRVSQGLPAVSFAQLPIQAGRFAKLGKAIAQALTDYDVEVGDGSLPENAAEWVSLAQERFEQEQAAGERREEPGEPTLAQAAVDLALRPYLEWAAEQVLPRVDQEHWKRGYCPVCGGAPDFATLDTESGARHLVCSRCNSQWLYRRLGCPFCGTTDHTRIVYYPSDDGIHRLYVCQECRRYLKTIDLRQAGRTVLLPVERASTVAMDAAAREEGYW